MMKKAAIAGAVVLTLLTIAGVLRRIASAREDIAGTAYGPTYRD